MYDFGGTTEFYCISQLPSGIFIGVRRLRPDIPDGQGSLEKRMNYMEIYCQNAEELNERDETVPLFCVGLVYADNVAIVTEDLSKNGQCEIILAEQEARARIIEGDSEKEVFIDLKMGSARHYCEMKVSPEKRYFHPNNLLTL